MLTWYITGIVSYLLMILYNEKKIIVKDLIACPLMGCLGYIITAIFVFMIFFDTMKNHGDKVIFPRPKKKE